MAESPACANAEIHFSEDYRFLIGSADYLSESAEDQSSTYAFGVNGTSSSVALLPERLLLHFDDSLTGTGAETPASASGYAFAQGKWASGLEFQSYGGVRYTRASNLDLSEGTIEMWLALRADGDDPAYAERAHYLFHYRAPDRDDIAIAHAPDTGVLYAGGTVDGEWQSAYGADASTRAWLAGEWRHIAYTFSASGNFMRFYVDGVLVADSNEDCYRPPSADADTFVIGGDVWGRGCHYRLDEVRIASVPLSQEQIAARAHRREPARAHEVWLDATQLTAGDEVSFAYTPANAGGLGDPCVSAPVVYPGIPLFDPTPPTTLLPSNTTAFSLSVTSVAQTTCRYAVGTPTAYGDMTPFDSTSPAIEHTTTIRGLNPDPNAVNDVYVRCAAFPDFALHLQYRCLATANPSYPRTGNLWGSSELSDKGLEYCARIDLWLGASFTPDEIRQLRDLNPHIRILTSINAVEYPGLPDDCYLKDVYGNRVEVWPGSYRLNLTKPEVAEQQARFAYQRILDSELMLDGCFFDNVMTTQSWQDHDIYGNPFLIDADEDGVADDAATFDAAWKAGVFHELETFRRLMPHALISGHSMNIAEPGIAGLFNGISVGFLTTDVLEDKFRFLDLWERYAAWESNACPPTITMFESAPPDQIAYGYGYLPWQTIPASTLEFARDYCPNMRFGLALTLMFDGYFAHEFGDTWHGNDWWYDELDFDLGYPLGSAQRVSLDAASQDNLIENASFEITPTNASLLPWNLWFDSDAGYAATVSRDTNTAALGNASARIDITSSAGDAWLVDFAQFDRSLVAGVAYDVVFCAKSDKTRTITLSAQKGSPDWDNYGLWRDVAIDTVWREYTVSFEAAQTVNDSRIQFMLGETTGTVWLDNVRLYARSSEVYRREFTNGIVLLNPTRTPQTVALENGFSRLCGDQAPRHEYIIDDDTEACTMLGSWSAETYDSGEWKAVGPFYHDWGDGCHQSSQTSDEARYTLTIPESDAYTLAAWWPAAPSSSTWTQSASYQIIINGEVAASATFDQRTGGDEWHILGTVPLEPGDEAFLRVKSLDGEACIADAVHVYSSSRYNDGSPASSVTLQPRDGIILARGVSAALPGDINGDGAVNATDIQLVVNAALGVPISFNADANADTRVDALDVQLVVNAALGILPKTFSSR